MTGARFPPPCAADSPLQGRKGSPDERGGGARLPFGCRPHAEYRELCRFAGYRALDAAAPAALPERENAVPPQPSITGLATSRFTCFVSPLRRRFPERAET
jgi:hypothetical protein